MSYSVIMELVQFRLIILSYDKPDKSDNSQLQSCNRLEYLVEVTRKAERLKTEKSSSGKDSNLAFFKIWYEYKNNMHIKLPKFVFECIISMFRPPLFPRLFEFCLNYWPKVIRTSTLQKINSSLASMFAELSLSWQWTSWSRKTKDEINRRAYQNRKFEVFSKVFYDEIQRCCDKKCIAQFAASEEIQFWREKVENGKCKGKIWCFIKSYLVVSDKREVFYDMKEHAIQPCEMAIKEITHLSKATINNLRSKVGAKSMKIFNITYYS